MVDPAGALVAAEPRKEHQRAADQIDQQHQHEIELFGEEAAKAPPGPPFFPQGGGTQLRPGARRAPGELVQQFPGVSLMAGFIANDRIEQSVGLAIAVPVEPVAIGFELLPSPPFAAMDERQEPQFAKSDEEILMVSDREPE